MNINIEREFIEKLRVIYRMANKPFDEKLAFSRENVIAVKSSLEDGIKYYEEKIERGTYDPFDYEDFCEACESYEKKIYLYTNILKYISDSLVVIDI